MSEPILVAGSFQKWDAILAIVGGAIAALVGLGYWGQISPWDIILLAIGVVLALVGVGTMMKRKAARRWVTIQPDGFLVQDRQGELEVIDDDVFAMSLSTKQNYSNGIYQSTTRQFKVWVELQEGPKSILMTTTMLPNVSDPLAPLVERIANKLRDEAENTLKGGHRVEGKGWALERDALHVTNTKEPERITFAELAAAEIYDGHVCVWKQGKEEPAARIPEAGENVWILLLLLQKKLSTQKSSDAPVSGLGRILFERRPSKVWAWLAWPLAGILLLLGGVMVVGGGMGGKAEVILIGLLFLGIGGLLVPAALASRRRVFRCHEYGVHSVAWFKERRLRYVDVASFTSQSTRVYVNGAYTGTQIMLRFEPLPDVDSPSIKYSANVKNADEALDMLRDHVARVIAGRLARDLSNGKPVAWGPNLTFEPEGFRYRPSGFLGRKEAVFLPYAEMARYQLDQGTFQIWMKGQKKASVSEAASQPNFFPGYFLFLMIINPSEPAAEAPTDISEFETAE